MTVVAREPHPFQYILSDENGGLPYLDSKDSPDGHRYAMIRSRVEDSSGAVSDFAGLRELQQNPISSSDLERLLSNKVGDAPDFVKRPVLHPLLTEDFAAASSDFEHSALVFADAPDLLSVAHSRNRAVANGLVATQSDAWSVEKQAIEARRTATQAHSDLYLDSLDQAGLDVTYACNYAPCFIVRGTRSELESISTLDGIRSIEPFAPGVEETNEINGIGIETVYQNKEALNHSPSYSGDASSFWGVAVAVLEFIQFNDAHPAFRESTSGSRIFSSGRKLCDTSGCSVVTSFSNGGGHATGSAGLLFGDLTDGQHSAWTSSANRRRRSSAGREARGYMYAMPVPVSDYAAAYLVALDDLPSLNTLPRIVSTSISVQNIDYSCFGMDTISRAVDEMLFENGIFFVNSAGNSPGTSTQCSVTAPGSAMGAFTVGAWGDVTSQGIYQNWCDARDAPLDTRSAWGAPSFYSGRGRSIIDLLGSYDHQKVPTGNSGYGYRTGTSVAAPAVAGSAVSFYDMYKSELGAMIDDPAVLYTWMLMMGDRDTSGVHLVEGFSRKWGAGRTRMRSLESSGLDAPSFVHTAEFCVDEGSTVSYSLNNGNPLPNDVDGLRAVVYWYTPSFNIGDSAGDIDLDLRGNGNQLLRSSDSEFDNKERVYYKDIGGHAVTLKLHGIEAPDIAHPECGQDSMKVYLAVLAEDLDRDDGNGPFWNSSSCVGVETW